MVPIYRNSSKTAGYEVELTYSDNETDRQVNDIQNLISDGVNLLVVAAIDGEALNTVMDEAAEAGIPVISYDRLIKSDAVSYYVSFDNYTVGTLQGQYVVDTLDLDNAGDKTATISSLQLVILLITMPDTSSTEHSMY